MSFDDGPTIVSLIFKASLPTFSIVGTVCTCGQANEEMLPDVKNRFLERRPAPTLNPNHVWKSVVIIPPVPRFHLLGGGGASARALHVSPDDT